VSKRIGLLLLVFLGFSTSVFGANINPSAISNPNDIAVDASGNLYISNSYSNLFKITPDGVATVLDGPGTAFMGFTVDKSGNVYVAGTDSLIWKFTSKGGWTILAGSKGVTGATNGIGTAASFNIPGGMAVDRSGNVYVADEYDSLIRKITRGGVVTTFAGGGAGSGVVGGAVDGKGTAASFSGLEEVAVDKSGNVYVVDRDNELIRKITPLGGVTTLAGSKGVYGAANGTGTAASFAGPMGIAVDQSGNVYVADYGNNLIRKITPKGVVTTLAGSLGATSVTTSAWTNGENLGGFADGTGTGALFHNPYGIAVDKSGNVYVADNGNNSIRKITSRGVVTTLAGARPGTAANGTAVAAASAGNSASASPASSGPLTLVCTPALGKSDPVQLILDESAGTADFGSEPVTTAGFNNTTVWWESDSKDPNYEIYYQNYYSLSRLTGVLNVTTSRGMGDANGNVTWNHAGGTTYNCKIGVEKRLF